MDDFVYQIYKQCVDNPEAIDYTTNKMAAQSAFCKYNKYPHFAPSNGICWGCGKQIYEKIDFSRAISDLITGCPHCNRSYCD